MASKGTTRLAQILSKRMHGTASYHSTISVEQGKVISGHKLKMDSLGVTIPRDGYETSDGLELSVGDRVVVSWASGDPVVVAKL